VGANAPASVSTDAIKPPRFKSAAPPIAHHHGQQADSGLPRGIGLLEAFCLAVYLIPRTSALGALLLTGFLGGAVATHLRVEDPLLSHVFFPVYVGLLLWGGLFLREQRLRTLVPVRK